MSVQLVPKWLLHIYTSGTYDILTAHLDKYENTKSLFGPLQPQRALHCRFSGKNTGEAHGNHHSPATNGTPNKSTCTHCYFAVYGFRTPEEQLARGPPCPPRPLQACCSPLTCLHILLQPVRETVA